MSNQPWDAVWINANIATMSENNASYGLISPGALAIKAGKIAWVGSMKELNLSQKKSAITIHDAQGRCITPGLIDCHTHLVYAGNRHQEFEMRLKGATYETIAQQGGGIFSTVLATRKASEQDLLQQSLKRAENLLRQGVTTLEIKSGYGLDFETELKILRVAKKIGEILPLTIVTTFLGAHVIPLEYLERRREYVSFLCDEMIPQIAQLKLAKIIDVFCEKIAFNLEETRQIFTAARKHQLKIKCHAEQLSHQGAAKLAAEYEALSVDHLEYLLEDDIKAIAQSGTVAVLLPGAFYFLRETKQPPIDLLRQYNIPMAIATDCNPGTSPITSLLLILNMACTLFGFTPEEALAGVTRHAAKALGLEAECGTLAPNKLADFVVWDIEHPAELAYLIGKDLVNTIVRHGVLNDQSRSSYLP